MKNKQGYIEYIDNMMKDEELSDADKASLLSEWHVKVNSMVESSGVLHSSDLANYVEVINHIETRKKELTTP